MHKEQRYVSTTRIIAVSLWVVTASLMLAAWVLAIAPVDTGVVWALLATTAGCLAVGAGVVHIKVFMLSNANLIRVVSGIGAPVPTETVGLRSVH